MKNTIKVASILAVMLLAGCQDDEFMRSANQSTAELPITDAVTAKPSMSKSIVRNIRLVEDRKGRFKTVVAVFDPNDQVSYVEVKLSAPISVLNPTAAIHCKESKENDRGVKRFVAEEISFEKDIAPIGIKYAATAIVMDINGKPIGEPVVMEIISETKNEDSPVLMESLLYSKDGGKTWSIAVTVADHGASVDKLEYVLLTPNYSGTEFPAVQVPILLLPVQNNGIVEHYEAHGVQFKGDIKGSLDAIVFLLGSGTRTSCGQANNKAELL